MGLGLVRLVGWVGLVGIGSGLGWIWLGWVGLSLVGWSDRVGLARGVCLGRVGCEDRLGCSGLVSLVAWIGAWF